MRGRFTSTYRLFGRLHLRNFPAEPDQASNPNCYQGHMGDLHDRHFLALGRVIAKFQQLELSLKFIAWHLISNDPQVGQAVTAHMNFESVRNICSSLLRHRLTDSHPLVDTLEGILGKARRMEKHFRNRLVHSAWLIEEDGDYPGFPGVVRLKFTAREGEGLRIQISSDALADLEDAIREFDAIVFDVELLTDALRNAGVVDRWYFPEGDEVLASGKVQPYYIPYPWKIGDRFLWPGRGAATIRKKGEDELTGGLVPVRVEATGDGDHFEGHVLANCVRLPPAE